MADTLFDVIVAALKTDYQAATGDTTTAWDSGKLKQAEQAEPRRIVFVRAAGSFGPPQRTTSPAQTPLVSQTDTVVANIYAEDDGTAEQIMRDLVRAYDRVLGGAWVNRAGDYEWFTQTEEGARHENAGSLVRLTAEWRMGLTEGDNVIVTLNGETHSSSLGLGEFDGSFSSAFSHAGSHESAC